VRQIPAVQILRRQRQRAGLRLQGRIAARVPRTQLSTLSPFALASPKGERPARTLLGLAAPDPRFTRRRGDGRGCLASEVSEAGEGSVADNPSPGSHLRFARCSPPSPTTDE